MTNIEQLLLTDIKNSPVDDLYLLGRTAIEREIEIQTYLENYKGDPLMRRTLIASWIDLIFVYERIIN